MSCEINSRWMILLPEERGSLLPGCPPGVELGLQYHPVVQERVPRVRRFVVRRGRERPARRSFLIRLLLLVAGAWTAVEPSQVVLLPDRLEGRERGQFSARDHAHDLSTGIIIKCSRSSWIVHVFLDYGYEDDWRSSCACSVTILIYKPHFLAVNEILCGYRVKSSCDWQIYGMVLTANIKVCINAWNATI